MQSSRVVTVSAAPAGETNVVIAFGLNEDGQCGPVPRDEGRAEGRQTAEEKTECNNYKTPMLVQFPISVIITSISAGSRHSLALSSAGRVYSWGWGKLGQLGQGLRGLGSSHSRLSYVDAPALIESLTSITNISAGGIHSGCLDDKGLCYMWGNNSYGQLGLGDQAISDNAIATSVPNLVTITVSSSPPSPGAAFSPVVFIDEENITALTNVKFTKLSCGGMHTAAVTDDGKLYCWGRADSGQTGYSEWYTTGFLGLTRPTLLSGLHELVDDVSCGSFHTLILTRTGVVYTIGKDDFGMLGIGRDELSSMRAGMDRPTIIPQFSDSRRISSVAAGGWHSCFLSTDGRLFVCGKGEYGRLGTGTEASVDIPVEIPFGDKDIKKSDSASASLSIPPSIGAKAISAGGSHTLLVDNENRFYAVGRLDDGRLGVNPSTMPSAKNKLLTMTHIDISQPLATSTLKEIIDIKAGGSHSLVLVKIALPPA